MNQQVDKKIQDYVENELKDFFNRFVSFRAKKITASLPDALSTANKTSGIIGTAQIANGAITQAKMANTSIGQAQLRYEVAPVTITAGSASNTAAVTAGDIVIGFYPTTNCDQVVKNISVSAGTLTVNLIANATNTTTINVVLLKT